MYYLTAYADELMSKATQLCLDDSTKPDVPTAPSPLASHYTHPDKDTIPLFSRYKQWMIISNNNIRMHACI